MTRKTGHGVRKGITRIGIHIILAMMVENIHTAFLLATLVNLAPGIWASMLARLWMAVRTPISPDVAFIDRRNGTVYESFMLFDAELKAPSRVELLRLLFSFSSVSTRIIS